MSIFKRLRTTISASVDQMVGDIENHDAVVDMSIKEARQAVARSKVRLAKLKIDGAKLKRRYAELSNAETQWTQRAKNNAEKDENKAIECLRRRNECQQHIAELAETINRHDSLQARLTGDIRTAEQKIAEMMQQRNYMRTRQSAAEALNYISDLDENMVNDTCGAFERWEVKVTESELEAGITDLTLEDSLEREFINSEERDSLKAELASLMERDEQ
jgi:phage shock protein A